MKNCGAIRGGILKIRTLKVIAHVILSPALHLSLSEFKPIDLKDSREPSPV
jgi:hypothetical protein